MDNTTQHQDFGEILIAQMKKNKISIAKVGQCLNLPKEDVIELMCQKTPPILSALEQNKLALLLHCETTLLFNPKQPGKAAFRHSFY